MIWAARPACTVPTSPTDGEVGKTQSNRGCRNESRAEYRRHNTEADAQHRDPTAGGDDADNQVLRVRAERQADSVLPHAAGGHV
jgi:hypothetical protein